MKVFGLCGRNSELCLSMAEGIVAALGGRGLEVSVVIESPEGFDLDRPGKDSFEHRRAGAHEVIIASSLRWAQLHEKRQIRAPQSHDVTAPLGGDLLLLLGFETENHARLAVIEDGETGAKLDGRVVALASATTAESSQNEMPVFGLEDFAGIADFILAFDQTPRQVARD